MLLAYIGVAIVLVLMIAFVAVAVAWTSRVVEKSIRDRSVSLLSSYDALLEERSLRLTELDRALREREAALEEGREEKEEKPPVAEARANASSASLLRAAERLTTASYVETGVARAYREIRRGFDLEPEALLQRLPAQEGRAQGGPAGQLLAELDFDTMYQLSTLPGERQLELLRQTVPAACAPLLEAFAAGRSGFDCLSFYDDLRAKAEAEPGGVVLRVPVGKELPNLPAGVRVEADEGICEGMQAEINNVLYDFSITAREIGA